MKNFEFKSAVCTSREQSEKLLALGLKKETADCRHFAYIKDSKGNPIPRRNQKWVTRIGTDESVQVCGFMAATFIPAWSLYRLLEVGQVGDETWQMHLNAPRGADVFDLMIECIEENINYRCFNEDYLEERK